MKNESNDTPVQKSMGQQHSDINRLKSIAKCVIPTEILRIVYQIKAYHLISQKKSEISHDH